MKHVYEIVNSLGTVEYVGQTNNPKRRWKEHVKDKPLMTGRGKFYGRQDVLMNIVAEVETLKEARELEEQLQLEYGLITDRSKTLKAAAIGIKSRWDSLSSEERSILNSNSAKTRWSKFDSEKRAEIIRKGHQTRKNKLITHVSL